MLAALARLDAGLQALAATRMRALAVLAVLATLLFLPGFASLPLTEWDEARYVQATTQMVASGDLIDIRFQDQPRHKKPVGIYWLQSAFVAALGGDDGAPLWVYRMPSLIAAVASVLLTWAIAAPLAGRPVAFVAALLMAAGPILGGEARLAKTDATLLATILGAQAILLRVWLAGQGGRLAAAVPPVPPAPVLRGWMAPVFWAVLAFGILVKGPIAPMVVGLTVLALCLIGRDWRWLAPLRSRLGGVLFALIVLPWFIAITIVSGGAFWTASLVEDLLAKVADGVEAKGAPPGYYLLSVFVTFWPAMLLLVPLLRRAWGLRAHPALVFGLAWLVPTWIVFEATPTKLVHYVLPVFPVIAIVAALAFMSRPVGAGTLALRIGAGAFALVPLAVSVGVGIFMARAGMGIAPEAVLAAVAVLALLVLLWRSLAADLRLASVALIVAMAAAAHSTIFVGLGRTPYLWASARAAEALQAAAQCDDTRLYTASYNEPALVFLRGGDLTMQEPEEVAAALAADPCALGLIADDQLAAYLAAAQPLGLPVTAVSEVRAIAIGIAREVHLHIVTPGPVHAVPDAAPEAPTPDAATPERPAPELPEPEFPVPDVGISPP